MSKAKLGPLRPPAPHDRWSEGVVFEMLKGPFPDGAFVRIPQVRNGTGYRSQARTADALLVSCWPSRGLWFAGVEIKVQTADWRRELAAPRKSAAIQQWCNYWYVACPKGIVPIGEIPPTWGLIECDARGCKIVKAAPRLKPKPPDAAFICAVLRQAMAGMVPACEVAAMVDKQADARQTWKTDEYKRMKERLVEFRKETGIDVDQVWRYGDMARAAQLVQRSGDRGLKYLAEQIKRQAETMVRTGCEVITVCDQAMADGEIKT